MLIITIAFVGFAYVIGLLFAVPDIDTVIDGGIVTLYQIAAGDRGGFGLTMLLIFNIFFAGVSSITVTTRITFALARDGAFPGSKHLTPIYQKTKSPLRTILLVYIVDALLLLLPLANTTAFAAMISLCTIGFQMSYAIPIWCRVLDSRDTFPQSDFNLGRFSVPLGFISASWLTITSCFFFWPSTFPVDPTVMNYTVVVVGGTFFIALVYWFVSARHFFKGPPRREGDVGGGAIDLRTLDVKEEEKEKFNLEEEKKEDAQPS